VSVEVSVLDDTKRHALLSLCALFVSGDDGHAMGRPVIERQGATVPRASVPEFNGVEDK
jgi:hypothetical protein